MAGSPLTALWCAEGLRGLASRRMRPGGRLLLFAAVFVPGALAMGFTFFWSNFLIDRSVVALLMPLSGVVILGSFCIVYRLLLLGLLALPGPAAAGSEDPDAGGTGDVGERTTGRETPGRALLAPGSERTGWLRTLGYGFLLPVSVMHLALALINAILLALGLRPAVVYLSDYLPFLGYLYALALSMQATAALEPRRRYPVNLRVLASFFASFALLTFVFHRLKLLAVGFFR